ncbi:TPA: YSIRK-type signal peptide-containing protein [Streptococcus suis]
MLGKNNILGKQQKSAYIRKSYAIKKLGFGVASILVGTGLFLSTGTDLVSAQTSEVTDPLVIDPATSQETDQASIIEETDLQVPDANVSESNLDANLATEGSEVKPAEAAYSFALASPASLSRAAGLEADNVHSFGGGVDVTPLETEIDENGNIKYNYQISVQAVQSSDHIQTANSFHTAIPGFAENVTFTQIGTYDYNAMENAERVEGDPTNTLNGLKYSRDIVLGLGIASTMDQMENTFSERETRNARLENPVPLAGSFVWGEEYDALRAEGLKELPNAIAFSGYTINTYASGGEMAWDPENPLDSHDPSLASQKGSIKNYQFTALGNGHPLAMKLSFTITPEQFEKTPIMPVWTALAWRSSQESSNPSSYESGSQSLYDFPGGRDTAILVGNPEHIRRGQFDQDGLKVGEVGITKYTGDWRFIGTDVTPGIFNYPEKFNLRANPAVTYIASSTEDYRDLAASTISITRFVDTSGRELSKSVTNFVNPIPIAGYVYVTTFGTEYIRTHVYDIFVPEIPDEAPTHEIPELKVTRFVDEAGNEIATTELDLVDPLTIQGYEYVSTTEIGKIRTHHYQQVVVTEVPNEAPTHEIPELEVTRFVDEAGNELATTELVLVDPLTIQGYEYVSTTEIGKIRTHHYQQVVVTEVPNEAPTHEIPELKVTRFVDEAGNELATTELVLVDPLTIQGYEYVSTTEVGKIRTHHYQQVVVTEIPNEAPTYEIPALELTRFVDGEGNEIAPKQFILVDPLSIEGYEYVSTLNHGTIRTHYYVFETKVPNEAPTHEIPALELTRFVDGEGNEIAPKQFTLVDPLSIEGYEYVSTLNHGTIRTHYYTFETKIPNEAPTHEVPSLKITRFIDEEGKDLDALALGFVDAKSFEGYRFVETVESEFIRTHIYKTMLEAPTVTIPRGFITFFLDENGLDLLAPQLAEVGPVAIDGYVFVKTETGQDFAKHYYKKLANDDLTPPTEEETTPPNQPTRPNPPVTPENPANNQPPVTPVTPENPGKEVEEPSSETPDKPSTGDSNLVPNHSDYSGAAVLPNTGESDSGTLFTGAALTILLGLGLLAGAKSKEDMSEA